MKKVGRILLWFIGIVLSVIIVIAGGYIYNNITYFDRDMTAVYKAGYTEKQVIINGSKLNYAEGPDNGTPLLLIHGQAVDWKNYAPVLPDLARHFHVYAVDCYGHGGSDWVPEKYSAALMGADFATFITEVIGEPVFLSGHSSGGQLSLWLAANHPEIVKGVVLEDPPLFTTLLPRAKMTWNHYDLATTAHNFLESGETDFVKYSFEHGKFLTLFKDLQPRLTADALAYRSKYPDKPVLVYYFPPALTELYRGMETYDPHFGQAFYDGSWNENFDHEEALARINIPAILIHANWSYSEDGILLAAMDDKDAERARSLIKGVQFIRVDSGHDVHFEKPAEFIRIMEGFKKR